jgi:hypothetical protein
MDIWHEKLFTLMTLGDDRVVKATYVMGKNAYQRGAPTRPPCPSHQAAPPS